MLHKTSFLCLHGVIVMFMCPLCTNQIQQHGPRGRTFSLYLFHHLQVNTRQTINQLVVLNNDSSPLQVSQPQAPFLDETCWPLIGTRSHPPIATFFFIFLWCEGEGWSGVYAPLNYCPCWGIGWNTTWNRENDTVNNRKETKTNWRQRVVSKDIVTALKQNTVIITSLCILDLDHHDENDPRVFYL